MNIFFKKTIICLLIILLIFNSFEKKGLFIKQVQAAEFADAIAQATAQTAACMGVKTAIRLIVKGASLITGAVETGPSEAVGHAGLPVGISGTNFAITSGKWEKTWADAWDDTKKCMREIAVKQLMDYTVDQVTDWIENGGDLGSRFTLDWERDKASAWNVGVGAVINDSTFSFLCSPFKAQVQLSFMPVQKFHKRLECTLDKIQANIDDFYADFNNGGWLAYNAMWEPQNNYFGATLLIHDEAVARGTSKAEAAINDLNAGAGFKSGKSCGEVLKAGDEVTDPWGGPKVQITSETEHVAKGGIPTTKAGGELKEILDALVAQGAMAQDSSERYCLSENLKNATPGRVAGDMTQKYLVDNSDSYLNKIADSDDWSKWIEAIANAATNRLTKEGLAALSSATKKSSTPSYTNPPTQEDILYEEIVNLASSTAHEITNDNSDDILSEKTNALLLAKNTRDDYKLIKIYQEKTLPPLPPATCLAPTITASDISNTTTTIDKLTKQVNDITALQTKANNFLSYLDSHPSPGTSMKNKAEEAKKFSSFTTDTKYSEAQDILFKNDALTTAEKEKSDWKEVFDNAATQLSECKGISLTPTTP